MADAKCPVSCRSYASGHTIHAIHASRVGETPWGWRDAVVSFVRGQKLTVDYLSVDGGAKLWHHFSLKEELPVGSLIRVHERFHVIGAPIGWLNVRIDQGIGAVPEPEDVSLWRAEWSPAVVNLATGRAIALDHRVVDK